MKLSKCRSKFLGEFIYTQIVRGKIEQCKHKRIYLKLVETTEQRERFH